MSEGDEDRSIAMEELALAVPSAIASVAVPAVRAPLDMQRAATVRRVNALFRAMSTDFLLREQFVTDPAQVVSEYVCGARLPADESSLANHLLYAVMSNRKLLGWIHDYSRRYRGNPPLPDAILRDLSRAVVACDAHHVVLALMRSALAQKNVLGVVQGQLADVLFSESGIFADMEGTQAQGGTDTRGPEGTGTRGKEGTGGNGGTRGPDGTGGTRGQEGTGTRGPEGTGTRGQEGTGTRGQEGTGTRGQEGTGGSEGTGETTRGAERKTTVWASLRIDKSGIEFFGPQFASTLNALVQYADHLRDTGALDVAHRTTGPHHTGG